MKAKVISIIRGSELQFNPGDIVEGDTAKLLVDANAAIEIKEPVDQEAEELENLRHEVETAAENESEIEKAVAPENEVHEKPKLSLNKRKS